MRGEAMIEMNIHPQKFKGKYRIASGRLEGWDYHAPGYYFVTICTTNRVSYFGRICEDKMQLSKIGKIAVTNLERIAQIYQNACLDVWVVMPNHVHAIIVLGEKRVETPHWGISTRAALGVVINQYKSACMKKIRTEGFTNFAWQARFYDHIIRNEKSLDKIREYINNNPGLWTEDEYYSNF
jgi:putative transposase